MRPAPPTAPTPARRRSFVVRALIVLLLCCGVALAVFEYWPTSDRGLDAEDVPTAPSAKKDSPIVLPVAPTDLPASPTISPDRRAAAWVLSIDGEVRIKENGHERQIRLGRRSAGWGV